MLSRSVHWYSAFGLCIRSEMELPDLVATNCRDADVRVVFRPLSEEYLGSVLEGATDFSRPGCTVRAAPNAICYEWANIGTALVRSGSEVVISMAPGMNRSEIAPFVTGALMGNLLDQCGYFVLHGSCVSIDGRAVAFLGEKGDGKSTLALHFQRRGFQLLSDDLLPLIIIDGKVFTVPGYPRIRIFADSALSVGVDPAGLPKFSRFIDKASFLCSEAFGGENAPLDRIYVLGVEDDLGIATLDPTSAFIELTRHTYLRRYLNATGKTAEYFKHREKLVSTVPVFKLNRPRDLSLLPEVVAAVIRHRS